MKCTCICGFLNSLTHIAKCRFEVERIGFRCYQKNMCCTGLRGCCNQRASFTNERLLKVLGRAVGLMSENLSLKLEDFYPIEYVNFNTKHIMRYKYFDSKYTGYHSNSPDFVGSMNHFTLFSQSPITRFVLDCLGNLLGL